MYTAVLKKIIRIFNKYVATILNHVRSYLIYFFRIWQWPFIFLFRSLGAWNFFLGQSVSKQFVLATLCSTYFCATLNRHIFHNSKDTTSKVARMKKKDNFAFWHSGKVGMAKNLQRQMHFSEQSDTNDEQDIVWLSTSLKTSIWNIDIMHKCSRLYIGTCT